MLNILHLKAPPPKKKGEKQTNNLTSNEHKSIHTY